MRKREHTSNVCASVLEEKKKTKCKVPRVDTLSHTYTRDPSVKKLHKLGKGDDVATLGQAILGQADIRPSDGRPSDFRPSRL